MGPQIHPSYYAYPVIHDLLIDEDYQRPLIFEVNQKDRYCNCFHPICNHYRIFILSHGLSIWELICDIDTDQLYRMIQCIYTPKPIRDKPNSERMIMNNQGHILHVNQGNLYRTLKINGGNYI